MFLKQMVYFKYKINYVEKNILFLLKISLCQYYNKKKLKEKERERKRKRKCTKSKD